MWLDTAIQTRENIPIFADLIPMVIVEEKNLGEDCSSQSNNSSEHAFYSNRGRGRGRGVGQGCSRGRGNQYQGHQQHNQANDAQGSNSRGCGTFRGKGSQIGCKNFQRNNAGNDSRECWNCGGRGHFQSDRPSRR